MAVVTCPDISRPQPPGRSAPPTEREPERADISPAGKSMPITAQFQSLDPDIVNEAIPAFFIGRNTEGLWVARDVKGKIGGIFLIKSSALAFARRHSRPAGCATIFPTERFELDLENNGNPLVQPVGSLMRLARRTRQWVAGLIGRLTHRSTPAERSSNPLNRPAAGR